MSGDVAKQLAFLQGAPLPPILVGTIRSPDGTEFDIGFVPLAFRPDSIVAVVGLKPHK